MWFKVDDHLHASRKAAKAGAPAMGLWVLAGSWSAAEELDGFVPAYMVHRLAGADGGAMAEALVAAGLWAPQQHEGEDGYRFHAWDEYQPTRAQLEAKREDGRNRMRRVRSQGGDVRAHTSSTADAVTPTPTRPDPTNKNTAADAAEFEAWWTAYPRKVGKTAAAKAYAKARKSTDADTLRRGLEASVAEWRTARTEPQFLPHPATWLNQGRWEDQHGTPALGGQAEPARPAATLNLCDGTDCPGTRHEWSDRHGRNRFVCMGVEA